MKKLLIVFLAMVVSCSFAQNLSTSRRGNSARLSRKGAPKSARRSAPSESSRQKLKTDGESNRVFKEFSRDAKWTVYLETLEEKHDRIMRGLPAPELPLDGQYEVEENDVVEESDAGASVSVTMPSQTKKIAKEPRMDKTAETTKRITNTLRTVKWYFETRKELPPDSLLTFRSRCPMAKFVSVVDAWNREYRFTVAASGCAIESAGEDGKFDTDDDIARVVKFKEEAK